MTNKKTQVLAAMLSAEAGVAPPPRARASSFASAVACLEVGSAPAAKVQQIDGSVRLDELTSTVMAELREKLRSAVTPAVTRAKRTVPGSEFTIEVTDFRANSGLYIIALVTRTA